MSSEDKLFWKRIGPTFYHNHHGTCGTALLAKLSRCIEKLYSNLFPARLLTHHGNRRSIHCHLSAAATRSGLTQTHTHSYKKLTLERERGSPSPKVTLTFPFVSWSGSGAAGATSVGELVRPLAAAARLEDPSCSEEAVGPRSVLLQRRWGPPLVVRDARRRMA